MKALHYLLVLVFLLAIQPKNTISNAILGETGVGTCLLSGDDTY